MALSRVSDTLEVGVQVPEITDSAEDQWVIQYLMSIDSVKEWRVGSHPMNIPSAVREATWRRERTNHWSNKYPIALFNLTTGEIIPGEVFGL